MARIDSFLKQISDTIGAPLVATSQDLARLTKGTAAQIATRGNEIHGDLVKLDDLDKQLNVLESRVIDEVKAALKTRYTVADEPPVPNKNYGEWLTSLEKDALGKKDPGPTFPGTSVATHAHHIVLKSGNTPARTADPAFVARQILWAYADANPELNPYLGRANLVWAPNWSHTNDYAGDVLKALLVVKDEGASVVIRALKRLAEEFINGKWHAS